MQIYYYTRTGRSRAIANKLANKYKLETNEIIDHENWKGAVGFLKGGAKALKRENVEINYKKIDSTKDIILVFPVWAGTYPPAIKKFIDENSCKDKMVLVPTSLGTTLKQRDGFKKVIDLVGKEIMNISITI